MILIPAIDIRGGKCVRLSQGKADQQKVYGEDPVDAALRWQSQGAQRLHIVDLDGAFEGKLKNADTIRRIMKEVKVATELGGGLRTEATVEEAFAMGIGTVILGTAAFTDQAFLKKTLKRYGDKVLVGIDAKDGWVQARGWTEALDIRAVDAAKQLEQMGAKGLVCTDIKTDGMLTGPNIPFLQEMLDTVDVDIIASGGVARVEDLEALSQLDLFGVIVGKALYEERFTVKEALAACSPKG